MCAVFDATWKSKDYFNELEFIHTNTCWGTTLSLLILCSCPVVWNRRVCCTWAYVSTINSKEIVYLGFVRQKYDSTYSFLLWNTYLGKTGFFEPVIYWKYDSASIFLLKSHLLISESWKTTLLPQPQITIVSPDKMRRSQYLCLL